MKIFIIEKDYSVFRILFIWPCENANMIYNWKIKAHFLKFLLPFPSTLMKLLLHIKNSSLKFIYMII